MLCLPDGMLKFLNEVKTISVFIQFLFDDTKFTQKDFATKIITFTTKKLDGIFIGN